MKRTFFMLMSTLVAWLALAPPGANASTALPPPSDIITEVVVGHPVDYGPVVNPLEVYKARENNTISSDFDAALKGAVTTSPFGRHATTTTGASNYSANPVEQLYIIQNSTRNIAAGALGVRQPYSQST